MERRAQDEGFTLIEMSIVLVIIGLIVGGVLVGRDLVRAAAVRAQVSQIEKYNQAVNTFRSKYDCLPGDCPNAVNFGLGTAGGAGKNGTGDFAVSGPKGWDGSWGPNDVESVNFWYHLAMAGLIDFKPLAQLTASTVSQTQVQQTNPTASLSTNLYIIPTLFTNWNFIASATDNSYLNGGNGYFIGGLAAFSASQASFPAGITPAQAYAIDAKTDDGLPYSGHIVRAPEFLGPQACSGLAACAYTFGTCATALNGVYRMSLTTAQCNLAWVNQF